MTRLYHKDGTQPKNGEIFVFGSNLAGRHGAGAARAALEKFGAVSGQGQGLFGQSYAIATKDYLIETMHLSLIAEQVVMFCRDARNRPDLTFFVTRIGCGLAGYSDVEVAPLFKDAPDNCSFAEEWRPFLEASA